MSLEEHINTKPTFLSKTKDFLVYGPKNPIARIGVASAIIYPVTAMVHNMVDNQLEPYTKYLFNLDTLKYAAIPILTYAAYKLIESTTTYDKDLPFGITGAALDHKYDKPEEFFDEDENSMHTGLE